MANKQTTDGSKLRLGKGIAALLSEDASVTLEPEIAKGLKLTPIESLQPNPNNPRATFDDENLRALSESIKGKGVLQPILIRSLKEKADAFEIVAGERRWRAAQYAGLHEVPTIILSITDSEALEIALIENIQRIDLNPLEEARGYAMLISTHQYTQEEVAKVVGKSRSHISNTLRLLTLPEHSRFLLGAGKLSAGHARALISTDDPDKLADRIIDEKLTVRDVEYLASSGKERRPSKSNASPRTHHADQLAWERRLSAELGTNVTVRMRGQGGEVKIVFETLDQLDFFVRKLVNSN